MALLNGAERSAVTPGLMSHWTGSFPGGCWSYHAGVHTDLSWRAYLAELERCLSAARGSVMLITLVHGLSPPSAAQRKALAELTQREVAKKVTHHCFIARSRVVQLTLTALDWLIKKHYQEKAFVNPMEGLRWVGSQLPGCDTRAIVEQIVSAVPVAALMPELQRSPSSAGHQRRLTS